MDRQIVYPGAIPLETDLLNTNKNAMIGLAKLSAAVLGTGTFINGLAVTPTAPASLQVSVAPGEIYSLQNIDGTAYSSIAADTTHSILKQGIMLDAATLSCPAPVTSGQSINYLIQVAYQDTDANAVVLPYYNASNPAQAYAGPNNSGTAQNTVRKGVCAVAAKAGIAATTGTQTTPAPDAGYIGAFVVTVAYGQASITAANISTYAGAPFIPAGGLIVGGLQGNACNISAAGGTADAITGSYTPGITALTNGMTLYVRAGSANATTTPSFTPASGTIPAKTIVKGAGSSLAAGDIAGGGHWIELQYDLTLDKWVLLNPATGVTQQSTYKQLQSIAASIGSNALTLTFNGGSIDFKNPTATNGVPNTLTVASNAITLPMAASLGAATGTTIPIVLLEAYNGGTPVACCANANGGLLLDETNYISPTTVGVGATSATTIYSASAVAVNSPYRIVGVVLATWVSGTGWTAIADERPAGGQSLSRATPVQSMVRLNTANGYGSTNTMIRRFTNVVVNQGADITYTDSATLGASFMINASGVYSISYVDSFNNTSNRGISLNSANLTTEIGSVPISEVLSFGVVSANYGFPCVWTGFLPAGSVIRAHAQAVATGSVPNGTHFTISRVG